MNENKKYTKLVLYLSDEMIERMQKASTKNKLSFGSLVREAVEKYLDELEKGK